MGFDVSAVRDGLGSDGGPWRDLEECSDSSHQCTVVDVMASLERPAVQRSGSGEEHRVCHGCCCRERSSMDGLINVGSGGSPSGIPSQMVADMETMREIPMGLPMGLYSGPVKVWVWGSQMHPIVVT